MIRITRIGQTQLASLQRYTSWTYNRGNFGAWLCIVACATSIVPQVAAANEDDVAIVQKYTPTGRHRIDLSYTRYDTFAGDVDLFLPTYTWAPQDHLLLSITGSIVANDLNGERRLGIGDTAIGIQFDPSARLAASPWVPDSIGFSANLIAPTGDARKGLSADTWFADIGAGWPIDSLGHLWIVPAMGYEFTFSEGSFASAVNQPYVTVDLVWMFEFGAWVSFVPRIGYEFEEDEWIDEFAVTAGKMFRNGFGFGLSYGAIEQISPGASRDDRTWLINLYYQFGKPPSARAAD